MWLDGWAIKVSYLRQQRVGKLRVRTNWEATVVLRTRYEYVEIMDLDLEEGAPPGRAQAPSPGSTPAAPLAAFAACDWLPPQAGVIHGPGSTPESACNPIQEHLHCSRHPQPIEQLPALRRRQPASPASRTPAGSFQLSVLELNESNIVLSKH